MLYLKTRCSQLQEGLRRRVAEVEAKLSSKNRNDLFSANSTKKATEKRGGVDSKEAATRLRTVNASVGQIINRGQVK